MGHRRGDGMEREHGRRRLLAVGLALLALFLWLTAGSLAPGVRGEGVTLHVDGATGQDIPTCGLASAPCRSVGYALGRAAAGDTIRVAQGVYTENLTFDKAVILEGGYEAATWTRDPALYPTILDGSNHRTDYGDFDGIGVWFPDVLADGGRYRMWYTGLDMRPWEAAGYAESVDGITWAKSSSNPLPALGVSGAGDLGNVESTHVITEDGHYKMWYGRHDAQNNYAIWYATSPDGLHWTPYAGNPVLSPGPTGAWDGKLSGPSVLKDGGIYRMWYYGWSEGYSPQIGYATSPDGIHWTKYDGNPVLSHGSVGSWNEIGADMPYVLWDRGQYRMWYRGLPVNSSTTIGYATSTDGVHWSDYAHNPILQADASTWEANSIGSGRVLSESGQFRMWYSGGGSPNLKIGYASSTNGITWTKYAGNPVLQSGGPGQWGQPVVQFLGGSDDSVLDGFTVRNGDAERGGGIRVYGARVTVRDCVVRDNHAYRRGGGIQTRSGAQLTLTQTQVLSNSVTTEDGAGIATGVQNVQLDIQDCRIAYNRAAQQRGGGLSIAVGSTTIRDSQVEFNTANGGGGLALSGQATVIISNTRIAHNRAAPQRGGGISIDGGSATVLGSQVEYNTANGGGGLATWEATIIISNTRFLGNVTSGGRDGGGIQAWGGSVEITASQLISNSNSSWGGGGLMSHQTRLRIRDSLFANNDSQGASALDLGDETRAEIDGNTIIHNRVGASGVAGGIRCAPGSVVTITNNVIAANEAYDCQGGCSRGVIAQEDSRVWVANNTIADNEGPGIRVEGAGTRVQMRNNILVGNRVGVTNNDSGAAVTLEYNDVWRNSEADYSGLERGVTDISVDPRQLDPAGDDYHLQRRSPCIDTGTNAGDPVVDYDIDGDHRPVDGNGDGQAISDIGADEYMLTSRQVMLPVVLKGTQ